MSSSVKTDIDSYFGGLTKKDIREVELVAKTIRINTKAMLRREVKRLKRETR